MIGRIAAVPILAALWLYQKTLSPLLGPRCRFDPSCSRYMAGAIRKDGVVRGLVRGLARVARCHPWHPGGIDPP